MAASKGRRSGLRWLLIGLLALAALLLAALIGGGTWLWRSDSALSRVAPWVPGLSIEGAQGRPTGGAFQLQRLQWQGGGLRVVVEDLAWDDASWTWRPHAAAWFGVQLTRPRAALVRVINIPDETPAPPSAGPPASLSLPLELLAPGLRVVRFELDEQAPITELAVDLHLGAETGAGQGFEHRAENLRLQRDGLSVSGRAVIGTDGGLPLQATLQVAPATPAAAGWRAQLQAAGPLRRLEITAQLSEAVSGSGSGSGSGSVSAQATLAPFAAWPVLALVAQADRLNLATWAGLPQTALSGQAVLSEPGVTPPPEESLVFDVDVANAEPGPWDAGRLPLRSLQLRVKLQAQGRPAEPGMLVFDRFTAELAAPQPAGRIEGSGRLTDGTLLLQLALDGVRPEQLISAAPSMRLGGKLDVVVEGLPNVLAAGSASAPEPAPARTLQAQVDVDLKGRLDRAGTPSLQLQTSASVTLPPDGTLSARLRELRGSAGGSGGSGGRASGQASIDRSVAGDWRLQTQGELIRFDPGPWWPAARGGSGKQALNARWQADMTRQAGTGTGTGTGTGASTQPQPAGGSLLSLLSLLRGNARLTLAPSRFAKLSLQGDASLRAEADAFQAQADLRAGRNRFELDGRVPHASGGADALPTGTLKIQAPALATLAPLAQLLPAAASAWWPREGSLDVDASAQGQWPALRSEGSLKASGLRSPQLNVGRAEAQWNLDSDSSSAPLLLQLQASDISSGVQRVEQLVATLEGTLREHRLQVRATSPARPPAWADALTAQSTAGGTAVQLLATGQWAGATSGAGTVRGSAVGPSGGGTWRGRIERLRAAPRAAPASPWLAADNLTWSLNLAPGGQVQQAALEPGRVALFGSGVNWQRATWQAGAGPADAPRGELRAQIEPLAVAPLLARLQPQFGWQGDLALSGRIDVSQAERLTADVLVERVGGDLSLQVEGVVSALQISDLRLGLSVKDGVWQATQALVGGNVGVVGGWQTVRAAPQALWPEPSAPLEGGLSLIVPQLQVWAPWLPAGWRLGGNLQASANLGGTAGQPVVRGEVSGENVSVRNLFEGINLKQGTLNVALDGTQATVRRAEFRDGAGEGWLRVGGSVGFGDGLSGDLRVSTEKLRALDRFDRRITVTGAADVGLRAQGLKVTGNFTIDEGLVDVSQADAPSLSADVVVLNRAPLGPTRVRGAPGASDAALKATGSKTPDEAAAAIASVASVASAATAPAIAADVDLRIDLGQQLRLRGRGLNTLLRGQLRVTTPDGQLAVNGVVRAEEGTYTAYGQNLRIERGNLVFRGDVSTPTLDILALRADIDQRVGVVVTGSAVNPRVRLYSEPQLDEFDTLTWLVLGRQPEGLGRDDTALLQRAALALLAGDRDGDSGLLQRLGLDELSLSRANQGGVDQTIVSLGKQISNRVYVGYVHALGAATGTLELIYRVANRVTLRARTGEENAVDVIWTWRWN